MNQNRMILGLVFAVVVAFVLSTFVYRQFKQASNAKPVATQHIVVASSPLQLGTRVECQQPPPHCLACRRTRCRHVLPH